MRGYLLCTLFLLLSFTNANANPITINAYNYPLGTDVSHISNDATLQLYTHAAYADSITYSPAITESVLNCEGTPYPPCQYDDFANTYLNDSYLSYLSGETSLNQDAFGFQGLSLSSEHPFNYFNATGVSGSGDGVLAFYFGRNNNYLGYETFYPTFRIGQDCLICYVYSNGTGFANDSVYRIDIGSHESNVVFSAISFSTVSEPPSLGLLSIGLLALLAFKQDNSIEKTLKG